MKIDFRLVVAALACRRSTGGSALKAGTHAVQSSQHCISGHHELAGEGYGHCRGTKASGLCVSLRGRPW